MKPTQEMLDAVAQSMRSLLDYGTPDFGVAIILWNMIACHVKMLEADVIPVTTVERAAFLRNKGYRWNSIVEELQHVDSVVYMISDIKDATEERYPELKKYTGP